jgi:hypothetical protein
VRERREGEEVSKEREVSRGEECERKRLSKGK